MGKIFNLSYGDFGGISIDKYGIPLTDETRGLFDTKTLYFLAQLGPPNGITQMQKLGLRWDCWNACPYGRVCKHQTGKGLSAVSRTQVS
ncbi:MAG: hypothetical protein Ct9H300mP11_15990 [Chloroflexota bacterium]|nr:MAG: hypothetical protein Ct9H300mP11_15990 [Chloroflexota bacterium]